MRRSGHGASSLKSGEKFVTTVDARSRLPIQQLEAFFALQLAHKLFSKLIVRRVCEDAARNARQRLIVGPHDFIRAADVLQPAK